MRLSDCREAIARRLVAILLDGEWTARALRDRMAPVLGPGTRAAQRVLSAQLTLRSTLLYAPSPQWLLSFLLKSRWLRPARRRADFRRARFTPLARFAGLNIPRITTTGDRAAWLGVSVPHLEWFADSRRQHAKTVGANLRHYTYAFIPKRSGTPRLIEAPKPRLMQIQRRILHEILDKVPVHPAAYGFVRGKSCLDGAQAHAGEHTVLTIDLTDFFLTTSVGRVHALFRNLGYPPAVARHLTGLCTTCAPPAVFALLPTPERHPWRIRKLHEQPHLAQGAPTSPALANLTAWRLDVRLSGLARGGGATYTRYADDIAFSGDAGFARRIAPFLATVGEIVKEQGFALNDRKTRIMPRAGAQRVTGVVVNAHTNVARESYDRLKAILHNCAKFGPETQNREVHPNFRAHLDGRVGWVEQVNPARGAKLRRSFAHIRWPD